MKKIKFQIIKIIESKNVLNYSKVEKTETNVEDINYNTNINNNYRINNNENNFRKLSSEYNYDVIPLTHPGLTIEDLEDNINKYIQALLDNIIVADVMVHLGNNLFVQSYEQNIRLFVSLFDYGDLAPVCARPDGEHKLIILDNGVVHSYTTDKPVGTINYDVSVYDFDFSSFRFCCEVVISYSEYLSSLSKGVSLADMIIENFNGKAPFDIEFAEKEKQS